MNDIDPDPSSTPPSTERLRFGFVCSPTIAAVSRLEALPIDSLWVGGHVASTNPTPEAMAQLARLSAVAERVQVGTSILLLPLYNPAIIAKQVADLDRATNGRIILGVGVGGEYPQEFRACGVPIEERGARTNEAIPLIRRLWSGEPVSHAGPFYPMDDVRIHPAPAQASGPPIIVSGRKPVAMRRAAAMGDGWMPYLFSARRYAASVETVKAHAASIGRDLTGFGWYAFLFVNVSDDSEQAVQATAEFLGGNYRQDFKAMVDSVAVAGSTEQVTQRLQRFVDAGLRHLIIAPAARADSLAMVERLTRDVLPNLQVQRTP